MGSSNNEDNNLENTAKQAQKLVKSTTKIKKEKVFNTPILFILLFFVHFNTVNRASVFSFFKHLQDNLPFYRD